MRAVLCITLSLGVLSLVSCTQRDLLKGVDSTAFSVDVDNERIIGTMMCSGSGETRRNELILLYRVSDLPEGAEPPSVQIASRSDAVHVQINDTISEVDRGSVVLADFQSRHPVVLAPTWDPDISENDKTRAEFIQNSLMRWKR